LIRVDLQEYIADPQRHALRIRDNDFDLPHVADHRPTPYMAQRTLSTAGCRALFARARRLPHNAGPVTFAIVVDGVPGCTDLLTGRRYVPMLRHGEAEQVRPVRSGARTA
jgi:hypothetical protein